MFFSIIIATYQAEKLLQNTLNSIANQSFKDFEIVIVDGNSTDNTLRIATTFSEGRNNVTIISEPDRGVYDALNKGAKAAKGKWLYFIGSDDILFDEMVLYKVYQELAKERVDLLYGDAILKSKGERYAGEFDILRLETERNICHQAIFYSIEIFEKVGYYNLRYKIWADWDLNIRCFRHPALTCKYASFVVAIYNDLTGVSTNIDDIFYKQLPIFYIDECKRKEKAFVNSRIYKNGLKIEKLINFGKKLIGK